MAISKKVLSSIFIAFVTFHGISQSNDIFEKQLLIRFDSIIGIENLGLINGYEYFPDFKGRTTHPNFESLNWEIGEIEYNGNYYPKVYLKYDIYKDVLVLGNPQNNGSFQSITVQDDFVLRFNLVNSEFVNILDQKGKHLGFYQVLYDGTQIDLLVKRRKIDKVNERYGSVEYEPADRFYLRTKNGLFEFRNKKTFYELYPQRKSEINQYIKEKDLKIKKNSLMHVADLTAYCNEF